VPKLRYVRGKFDANVFQPRQGSAARVAELLTDAPARAGATLESPAEALPGLVTAFRLKPDGTAEELAVDLPIAEEPRGWLWLHFNLADRGACHFLRLSFYFPPRRESCSSPPTTTNSSMRARLACSASFPISSSASMKRSGILDR